MAVEIRHSRTATLVDSPSNPGYNADELQAADWNDTHPITADGPGILAADTGGNVAERTTIDAGTLTASNPWTFKQTWDNAAQDVTFRGFVVEVVDDGGLDGALASSYFDIKTGASGSTVRQLSYGRSGLLVNGSLQLFDADLDTGNVVVDINASSKSMVLGTIGVDNAYTTYAPAGPNPVDVSANQSITYGPYGPAINLGKFFLPNTQGEVAVWAGNPTNTDIDDGYWAIGRNSSSGDKFLAMNVGGTIFKVQLV